MGKLDVRVEERIQGPGWANIRDTFYRVNSALLNVSSEARGQLTTIYVKYTSSPTSDHVYAVVWLKSSKEILVGLAMPDTAPEPKRREPFPGTKYKGLTRYFALRPGDTVPERITEWAMAAYEHIHEVGQSDSRQ